MFGKFNIYSLLILDFLHRTALLNSVVLNGVGHLTACAFTSQKGSQSINSLQWMQDPALQALLIFHNLFLFSGYGQI